MQKPDQGSSAVICGKINFLGKMENFLNDAAKFENIDLMSDRKMIFCCQPKKKEKKKKNGQKILFKILLCLIGHLKKKKISKIVWY